MRQLHEKTIPAVFFNRAARFGSSPCVYHKNLAGEYVPISWERMEHMVTQLATYLQARGIRPGDRVAVFAHNRYEWWVSDLAILSVGAVNVPIYATNSSEEAAYILNDSGARLCFAGTRDQLDRVLAVKDKLDDLEDVIVFDVCEEPGVRAFGEALKLGRDSETDIIATVEALDPQSCATMIYTSGTTGSPKGVMLSHFNILTNTRQSVDAYKETLIRPQTMLSFLPLSHAFERICGYYLAIDAGVTVYFAESFGKLLKNLQEVRPTIVVSVPRLYEKLHAGVQAAVEDSSRSRRAIFNWAMGIARRNVPYVCEGRSRHGHFAMLYRMADRLVLAKLRHHLGIDRLELAISGGGPLSEEDVNFFLGMGAQVMEGFGMSETSPVTHCNRVNRCKPGTVGEPMRDTEAKTGPGGELLIRGPQVMLGYFRNEEATREAFTDDGFFHSGDIANIDDDGYLTITGRIKDIIITAGGKNVSPQNIENSIRESPFIAQVGIIGDRRKYLSALLVPAFDKLEAWAEQNDLVFESRRELVELDQVVRLFELEVKKQTEQFSRVEKIKKFTLLVDEWSQETEELTATLKLKRQVINTKYADEIEKMY